MAKSSKAAVSGNDVGSDGGSDGVGTESGRRLCFRLSIASQAIGAAETIVIDGSSHSASNGNSDWAIGGVSDKLKP